MGFPQIFSSQQPRPPGRAHRPPEALGHRRRRGGAPPGIRRGPSQPPRGRRRRRLPPAGRASAVALLWAML
eukprot:15446659-Alexandrium_andersonii.AAC.1